MGIHPMQDSRHCPRCGRDLSAGPRPERVKVPGFPAAATYGLDPVCKGRWHIWDKTSPLHAKAQPHVDATNGFLTAAEAHGIPGRRAPRGCGRRSGGRLAGMGG